MIDCGHGKQHCLANTQNDLEQETTIAVFWTSSTLPLLTRAVADPEVFKNRLQGTKLKIRFLLVFKKRKGGHSPRSMITKDHLRRELISFISLHYRDPWKCSDWIAEEEDFCRTTVK